MVDWLGIILDINASIHSLAFQHRTKRLELEVSLLANPQQPHFLVHGPCNCLGNRTSNLYQQEMASSRQIPPILQGLITNMNRYATFL